MGKVKTKTLQTFPSQFRTLSEDIYQMDLTFLPQGLGEQVAEVEFPTRKKNKYYLPSNYTLIPKSNASGH